MKEEREEYWKKVVQEKDRRGHRGTHKERAQGDQEGGGGEEDG